MTSSGERPPELPNLVEPADLYRIALDEYRFQVDLNWKRTEHWFTLNVAIAGAAIALLRISEDPGTYLLVAAVFACGVLASVAAIIALHGQHDYYRQARAHKQRIEQALNLGDFAIETTPGMRGKSRDRWRDKMRRVTTIYTVLLSAVALLDAGGVVYAVCAAS